jgi:uncharacterized phiE125 gp8 family phage protein
MNETCTIRRAVRTVATTLTLMPLDELKLHLGLPSAVGDDDSLLRDCLAAAIESWEADTPMVVLTSTWAESFDVWPYPLVLTKRPVASISSITYLDSSGGSQTLATSYYTFDANRVMPTVFWKPNTTLPTLSTVDDVNRATVTYVAGTAVASVPTLIKQAIKLKAGEFFNERGVATERNIPLDALAYERIAAKFMRSSYP